MKKYLLSICSLLVYYFSLGQPTPGSYVTNSNVDQLVGTWKWISGQDVVEIKLQKVRHTVVNYDEDILLGTHKYIQNGVEIQNSMAEYNNIQADHKKATVHIYNDNNSTTNFSGSLQDLTKNKLNELTLVLTTGSPPTLTWTLKTGEHVSVESGFQYGLTLPAQIVLVKQ